MQVVEHPLLALLPLAMVGAGLLVMALAELLGRVLALVAAGFAWATGLAVLVATGSVLFTHGGWARVAEGGYTGAFLVAPGTITLGADPASWIVVVAIHLGGGGLLLGAAQAWGGGKRRENAPISTAQVGGSLLLLGLVEAQAWSLSLGEVFAFASLASAAGALLLLTSRGRLDGLAAAGRLFIIHRLGDLALLLAAAILLAAFGTLDAGPLLAEALRTPPHLRAGGSLSGYPGTWLYVGVVVALATAVATRVAWLPFSGFLQHSEEAPAPVLGLVHGVAFAGSGLVLAIKVAPFLPLAPGVTSAVAVVAALSAALVAASALATDDVMVAAQRYLYGWAALPAAAVFDGQALTGSLGAALFFVALPALWVPLGAAVEALQGNTSLRAMGGLWRPLRRSDTLLALTAASLVGFPGLAGFFFLERTVYGALVAARPNPAGALLACGFVFLSATALWRVLHLAFSGDAPRERAPAILVDARPMRVLLPAVLTLVLIGAGVLTLLPEELLSPYAPDYFTPFDAFVAPAAAPFFAAVTHVGDARMLPLPGNLRLVVMGVVASLSLLGYAVSRAAFRAGNRRRLARLLESPLLSRIGVLLDSGLNLQAVSDRLLAVPLSQASRVFAGAALPVLVEGPLSRFPTWAVGAVQICLRLLHSGDVQRSLAIIAVALGAALVFFASSCGGGP